MNAAVIFSAMPGEERLGSRVCLDWWNLWLLERRTSVSLFYPLKTSRPNFHRSSCIVRISDTEIPAKQSLCWPFRFSLTHALFTRWGVNNAHKREIACQSDWLKHQDNIRIYVIIMQFRNFHWLYQYGKWMRDVLKCFFLFYFSFLCFGVVLIKQLFHSRLFLE